jgi:hypothetical protein
MPDREARSYPSLQKLELVLSVEWSQHGVEWNWRRFLQEVTEEWEVRGLCVTRRSGPRVVWLLGRKSQLTVIFVFKSNQKGHLPLTLCPKVMSV